VDDNFASSVGPLRLSFRATPLKAKDRHSQFFANPKGTGGGERERENIFRVSGLRAHVKPRNTTETLGPWPDPGTALSEL